MAEARVENLLFSLDFGALSDFDDSVFVGSSKTERPHDLLPFESKGCVVSAMPLSMVTSLIVFESKSEWQSDSSGSGG